MLTIERLCEVFDYDPLTGIIIRKMGSKGYHPNRQITRKNDKGYLVTTLDGKTYRVHQLIWFINYGSFVDEIDHENRVRDDNRLRNLRLPTRLQNVVNSGPKSAGYKGVTFCKCTQRWRAQIGFEYRNIHIGRYDTAELAALAYNKKARELFGEFAYMNKVM